MDKIRFWKTISAYLLRPLKKLTAGKQQPVFDLPNAVPVELPAPIDASERERKQPNAIVNERNFSHASDDALPQPPGGFRLKAAAKDYDAWLEVNRWNERRKRVLQAKIDQLKRRPLFSIVMPVWNPPIAFFELALESLSRQVYPDWELCIVDDASTDPAVKAMIGKWLKKDGRIRAEFNDNNGNISAASNRAASMASGEFLVFLDQDDELTPNALGELAAYVDEHSDADVVYSDDDKIDAEGRRFDPQFKPDWSPELLLSFMYFSHLFVVRTALFRKTGGMRLGFEGSQDYDLALRVTEKARHIGHIPLVLYHWRVHSGSTASSGAAKPSSFEAGRRAVQEAFDRRGVRARVVQPDWAVKAACGIFSPVFPDEGPKVAVLIATKNRHEILKNVWNRWSVQATEIMRSSSSTTAATMPRRFAIWVRSAIGCSRSRIRTAGSITLTSITRRSNGSTRNTFFS
nr:glycosyltransferase [Cohnella faecalis]